jgi:hypothetical protein
MIGIRTERRRKGMALPAPGDCRASGPGTAFSHVASIWPPSGSREPRGGSTPKPNNVFAIVSVFLSPGPPGSAGQSFFLVAKGTRAAGARTTALRATQAET